MLQPLRPMWQPHRLELLPLAQRRLPARGLWCEGTVAELDPVDHLPTLSQQTVVAQSLLEGRLLCDQDDSDSWPIQGQLAETRIGGNTHGP